LFVIDVDAVLVVVALNSFTIINFFNTTTQTAEKWEKEISISIKKGTKHKQSIYDILRI
jgi:hypothetical protein